MQLSICCSSRAAAMAGRLAERLERNLGIRTLRVEEDEVPVSETWEEGAAADAILILLDRLTAPPPMRREAWTGLLEHAGEPPVAFVRLEECAFPKLLERRPFFPSADPVALDRAIERWLANQLPALPGLSPEPFDAPIPPEWWTALADTPGQAVTTDINAAHAFVQQAAGHFQGIVWIGCAGRDPAVIRAELEYRVRDGRTLAVLAHIGKPLSLPEGRHSYLQVTGPPPAAGEGCPALGTCYAPVFPGWLARELGADLSAAILLDRRNGLYRLPHIPPATPASRERHLDVLHRTFAQWKSDPDPCRALLYEVPAALQFGFDADWPRAVELARRAAFRLRADGRRREAIRLLNRLLIEADEQGDTEAAADARHELSWLTDEDLPPQTAPSTGEQLAFDLLLAPGVD